MACIIEKLSANLSKEVTAKSIWDHLATMYDLKKLVSDKICVCVFKPLAIFTSHTCVLFRNLTSLSHSQTMRLISLFHQKTLAS